MRIAAAYNDGETTLTFEKGDQTVTKKALGFLYIAVVADDAVYELPHNAEWIKIWRYESMGELDLSDLGLKTPITGAAIIENTGDSIRVWVLPRRVLLDHEFNTSSLREAGIRPIELTI
jgi:hypothetical protein